MWLNSICERAVLNYNIKLRSDLASAQLVCSRIMQPFKTDISTFVTKILHVSQKIRPCDFNFQDFPSFYPQDCLDFSLELKTERRTIIACDFCDTVIRFLPSDQFESLLVSFCQQYLTLIRLLVWLGWTEFDFILFPRKFKPPYLRKKTLQVSGHFYISKLH